MLYRLNILYVIITLTISFSLEITNVQAKQAIGQLANNSAHLLSLEFQPFEKDEILVEVIHSTGHTRVWENTADFKSQFFDSNFSESRVSTTEFVSAPNDQEQRWKFTCFNNQLSVGIDNIKTTKSAIAGKAYSVMLRDGKLSIKSNNGPLSEEEAKTVELIFSGDSTVDLLGRFISNRDLKIGKVLPLSKELANRFGGSSGQIIFKGVENRWHRDLAHFKIQINMKKINYFQSNAELKGSLFFDKKSGRPYLCNLSGRHLGKEATIIDNKTFNTIGTFQYTRIWAYPAKGSADISANLIPQISPIGRILSLDVSPDGKRLAILSQKRPSAGKQLSIWDIKTRMATTQIPAIGFKAEFAPKQNHLFLIGNNSFGSGWTMGNGAGPARFGKFMSPSPEWVATAMSMAGMYPCVGYKDGKIRILNFGWNRIVGELSAHSSKIVALAVSPDGTKLASVDKNGEMVFRSLRIGTKDCKGDFTNSFCERATMNKSEVIAVSKTGWSNIKTLVIHPDGETVAGANVNGDIIVWSVNTDQSQTVKGGGQSVEFTVDGKYLVSGQSKWRILKGKELEIISNYRGSEENYPLYSHIAATPNGQLLFRSQENQDTVEAIEMKNGIKIWDIASNSLPIEGAKVIFEQSLVASSGNKLIFWNLAKPNTTTFEVEGNNTINNLITSGDGKYIGILTESKIEKISTDNLDDHFTVDSNYESLALSQDGEVLAAGTITGQIEIWDAKRPTTRQSLSTGNFQPVMDLVFSPLNNNRLFSLSLDGTLRGWDLSDRSVDFIVKLGSRIAMAVADNSLLTISSNGQRLAITSVRSTDSSWHWNKFIPVVQVFDAKNGDRIIDLHPKWGTLTAVQLSSDGRCLVAGNNSGTVYVWDVDSGRIFSEFQAHNSKITGIGFMPGEERFFTSSVDGSIKLWQTAGIPSLKAEFSADYLLSTILKGFHLFRTIQHVATLVAIGQSDNVIATPDGYYAATLGALKKISFERYGKAFDFEQFDLLMNRPDIVYERLGYISMERIKMCRAARKKRIEKLGVFSSAQEFMPPSLKVEENLPTNSQKRIFEFKVKAKNENGLLAWLRVRVNSVPLWGKSGKPLAVPEWEGQVKLKLSRGENRIQVSAVNEYGVESSLETFVVNYTGHTKKPNLWILAIGVSEYENIDLKLQFADNDAEGLADFLANHSTEFDKINVRKILNRDATRENILKSKAFLKNAAVDDLVLVFLSGHGFLDENLDYYFGVTDIDPRSPSLRGLKYSSLEEMLDGIIARKKMLLIDSCHAGETDKTTATTSNKTTFIGKEGKKVNKRRIKGVNLTSDLSETDAFDFMQELFFDLRLNSGTIVLASSAGAEYSVEDEIFNSHGVFTFAILEGLHGHRADDNRDGHVSALELQRYVNTRVVDLTQGEQNPTARQINLDLDFLVY